MKQMLITLDVGGTIIDSSAPSIASALLRASPIHARDVRRILREKLYTQASIDATVVADVCNALHIPLSAFPPSVGSLPLRLVPGAISSLRSMRQNAILVTLSNVTCLESQIERLRQLLHPWVEECFPSCQIGYSKPDPAAFRYVASVYGHPTSRMVHIGDDWDCDVLGAVSAGATAVWISKGRPVPDRGLLASLDVLVATDLVEASRQVAQLATRRQS